MKKFNLWTCVFLIQFIILFAVFNIPYPICKTIDSVEINMEDPTHYIPRTIEIDGHMHLNMFSRSQFKGHITVSGYETYTDGREKESLNLSKECYPLTYTKLLPTASKEFEFIHFGRMYTDLFFNKAMIAFPVNEKIEQQTTANCNIIVANASSPDETYKIACQYFWPAK